MLVYFHKNTAYAREDIGRPIEGKKTREKEAMRRTVDAQGTRLCQTYRHVLFKLRPSVKRRCFKTFSAGPTALVRRPERKRLGSSARCEANPIRIEHTRTRSVPLYTSTATAVY